MTHKLILSSTVAVLALAVAMPATVFAQAAPPAATEDRSKVETIIVTARKTSETLIGTPVAVTAVGAADISRLNVQSIDDLARFTPGLSFSKAFGRSTDRPVVRGAASILAGGTQAGVESGTAFFVDGVYYQGDISSIDMSDVARVEIIKGPQSALYGRNTYSGAINYITNSPGSAFKASATLSGAQFGERSLTARVGGPLGDRLSGSLSLRLYETDGEWRNSTAPTQRLGAEKTTAFAGVIEARPIDGFTLRGRMSYAKDDDGPRAFGFQNSDSNNCYPGFKSNLYSGVPATTNNNPNQYFCGVIVDSGIYAQNTGADGNPASGPFFGVQRDQLFGSLIATIDLPNQLLAEVSVGYRDATARTGSDSDFQAKFTNFFGVNGIPTANTSFGNHGFNHSTDLSLEAKISSPLDRRLRWMVGVYGYNLDETSYNENFSFATDTNYRRLSGTNSTFNTALFARVGFNITDKLTIDVEGRQQSEDRSTQSYSTTTGVTLGNYTYNDSRNFKEFTPRATLSWKPTENQTLFLIGSKGTKPGGLNGATGASAGLPRFEPEESENLEIGYKARLLGGRGTIALAAYTNKATSMQLTTAVANPIGGNPVSVTSNQGDAEIKGLEADFRFRVTSNFGIGLTYSYVDATFTKGCDAEQFVFTSGGFNLASPPLGTPNPCNLPVRTIPTTVAQPNGTFLPNPGASGSIVGNKVPLVPETQASFNFDYSRKLGSAGIMFFASGDISYESAKFVQVHGGANTGDTTLVGGRFGISNDNWRLSIWGKNLTDEDTIPIATRWFDIYQGTPTTLLSQAGVSSGIGTGPRGFFYAPRAGRTIGAELKWTY
jgi:iron complex outermembrane recepter protein